MTVNDNSAMFHCLNHSHNHNLFALAIIIDNIVRSNGNADCRNIHQQRMIVSLLLFLLVAHPYNYSLLLIIKRPRKSSNINSLFAIVSWDFHGILPLLPVIQTSPMFGEAAADSPHHRSPEPALVVGTPKGKHATRKRLRLRMAQKCGGRILSEEEALPGKAVPCCRAGRLVGQGWMVQDGALSSCLFMLTHRWIRL